MARPCTCGAWSIRSKALNDQAPADFNKALETHAANDKALYSRGILYFGQGRYDLALAFNQALKLNPNHAEAYNNRGSIFWPRASMT